MPNWGWYLLGILAAVLLWGYIRKNGHTVPGLMSSGAQGFGLSTPTLKQNSAQVGTQMGVPYVSPNQIFVPNDQPIAINQLGGSPS